MLEIDHVTDYLDMRVTKMTTDLGFRYTAIGDTSPHVSHGLTKYFNLHTNIDDTMFPLTKINSFLLQLHDALANESTNTKSLQNLSIEGPSAVSQTCFINRQLHTHYVWTIALAYSNASVF